MKSDDITATAVLEAIEPIDPDLARLAREHAFDIIPLDAPSLEATRIIRLDILMPERPLFAHYAIRDGKAWRLTDDPAAFDAAVTSDPGMITDAAEAVALVAARVAATRKTGTRRLLVQQPSDLPWRPRLDETAKARKAQIEDRLGPARPTVSATPEGFAVDGWVLSQNDLIWTRFTLSPRGIVKTEDGERLTTLPFTYAR